MHRILFLLAFWFAPAFAEVPRVAVDIAPVHGLVARVMDGVGTPDLVVPAGASPHHHAMRPSEAQALAGADVVIWVGHALTPWLEGSIMSLAGDAIQVELMDVTGVTLLEAREGGVFEGHEHGEDHGMDPHLWLDPDNAALWLQTIAGVLAEIDPKNAEKYQENATDGMNEIARVDAETTASLAPIASRPFIMLHDGFHYFEAHYDLKAFASVSASDAEMPGPARLAALRREVSKAGVSCAISEPQLDDRLLKTVTEGLQIKRSTADPIGVEIPLGPAHYPALLKSVALSFADCLAP